MHRRKRLGGVRPGEIAQKPREVGHGAEAGSGRNRNAALAHGQERADDELPSGVGVAVELKQAVSPGRGFG